MNIVQKKICLIGDFSVGKTSLVRRFVEGRFEDKYLSTIGVKISRKTINRETHQLNLILWDLAGGEGESAYPDSYLRGAAGALVVFDLSRPKTLESLQSYQHQILEENKGAVVVVLGNKADLLEGTPGDNPLLQALEEKIPEPHLLTSAKTGENVEAAFHLLADSLELSE
jgi:small GTP-binding protein